MKKKMLAIAGIMSCAMMIFSLQANEAKEPSMLKVSNGSWVGEEEASGEARIHPKCPGEQRWVRVKQPDGKYRWECATVYGEEDK